MTRPRIEWEQLDTEVWRAPVYGGWLIKHWHELDPRDITRNRDTIVSVDDSQISITFIPDPMHEWSVERMRPRADDIKRLITQTED